MAFTQSKMFREWPSQVLQKSGTNFLGMGTDVLNVALYNNSGTPDKDAAVGSTGYNTGAWAVANEVTDATNWVAGGRALSGKTFSTAVSGACTFDATDLAGGGTLSLSNVYGCLIYDNAITGGTVAKQGISFHYFGGPQTVSAGTFTVVWNASGIFTMAV